MHAKKVYITKLTMSPRRHKVGFRAEKKIIRYQYAWPRSVSHYKSNGPKIPIGNNKCPSEDRDIVAPFPVQENYALNVEMDKTVVHLMI
jgi:hypothetical protein